MSQRKKARAHVLARAAHKLRLAGHTTREIAEQLGIKPEVVKARVLLGERLAQGDST